MTRRALSTVVAALALIPISLLGQESRSTASPLLGVWRAAEVLSGGAANPATKTPQPYIRIYTGKHFSLVGVYGDNPRAVLQPLKTPENPTDAEKLAASQHWLPFQAQTGTYEVKGNTVVHTWIIGKNQTAKPTVQRHEFKFDGPNTLFLRNEGNLHIRYTRLE